MQSKDFTMEVSEFLWR